MKNPDCGSCELACELAGVRTDLSTALAEAGSPAAEAQFGVEIAEHDRDGLRFDEELVKLSGQTGLEDPDQRVNDAVGSYIAAQAVTDAYGNLQNAQHAQDNSLLINEGPRQVAAVDNHLARLNEWCPGPQRGVTLPLIGFVALGFGEPSCGSPRASLARATIAGIRRILS